jgi:hypothetical protein
MPLLRDPDGVLNDLNRAKAKINKNNRRNVKGLEEAPISGSTGDTTDLFEAFTKRLVDIKASLFEVNSTIDLVVTIPGGVAGQPPAVRRRDVAELFSRQVSALIRQTADLDQFTTRKLKNDLDQFSGDQFSEIDKLLSDVNTNFGILQASINANAQDARGEPVQRRQIAGILIQLNTSWVPTFNVWLEKINNLAKAYGPGGSVIGRGMSGGNRPSHYEPTYTVGDQGTYGPRRYL